MNKNKSYRSSRLQARLSFNDGYAENPMYSIKAVTSEKHKGLDMISLIMDNFSIMILNIEEHRKIVKAEILAEMNHLRKLDLSPPMKLNRDEKGNLASPFATKKKSL